MDKERLKEVVRTAIEEDVGSGDITTESVIPQGMKAKARIVANEDCIACGLDVAGQVFSELGGVDFRKTVKDGDFVKAGNVMAEVKGNARSILTGERTALNFIQRLSGIATRTRGMVEKAGNMDVRILDTRKTTPGLRELEKYAVYCGGGQNHRKGLFDGILIKDNHIKLVGIEEAVKLARATGKKVEVETKNEDEVRQSLLAGADIIMLDNMDIGEIKEAVKIIGKKAVIEVSGGITEGNVSIVAGIGVDWISVGALTHSVRSIDIGLDVDAS